MAASATLVPRAAAGTVVRLQGQTLQGGGSCAVASNTARGFICKCPAVGASRWWRGAGLKGAGGHRSAHLVPGVASTSPSHPPPPPACG